jgi:hypothetical protein
MGIREDVDQIGLSNVNPNRDSDVPRETVSTGTQRQFEPSDPTKPPDIEAFWQRTDTPVKEPGNEGESEESVGKRRTEAARSNKGKPQQTRTSSPTGETVTSGTQRQFAPHDPSQPPDIEAINAEGEPDMSGAAIPNLDQMMEQFRQQLQEGMKNTDHQLQGAQQAVRELEAQRQQYADAMQKFGMQVPQAPQAGQQAGQQAGKATDKAGEVAGKATEKAGEVAGQARDVAGQALGAVTRAPGEAVGAVTGALGGAVRQEGN